MLKVRVPIPSEGFLELLPIAPHHVHEVGQFRPVGDEFSS